MQLATQKQLPISIAVMQPERKAATAMRAGPVLQARIELIERCTESTSKATVESHHPSLPIEATTVVLRPPKIAIEQEVPTNKAHEDAQQHAANAPEGGDGFRGRIGDDHTEQRNTAG